MSLGNNTFTCTAPTWFTDSELEAVVGRNCAKVRTTAKQFEEVAADFSLAFIETSVAGAEQAAAAQRQAWLQQAAESSHLCDLAVQQLGLGTREGRQEAAHLAVNAWGSAIMGGQECCTMLDPPYCVASTVTGSAVLLATPFGVLVLLFLGSLVSKLLSRPKTKSCSDFKDQLSTVIASKAGGEKPKGEKAAPSAAGTLLSGIASALRGVADGVADSKAWSSIVGADALKTDLQDMWLRSSSLRVLPGAAGFAESSASLFDALQKTFDFQIDSVKNQFEHLMSLWRSQCAMVADRSVDANLPVDETNLLEEAIGDVHADLLDGFLHWRKRLQEYGPADVLSRADDGRNLGGIRWVAPPPPALASDGDESLSMQLAEIAAYLLVWGEGGNVRFMPEVIYFITELALTADTLSLNDLYDREQAPDACEGGEGGAGEAIPFRSSLFLSSVIRPIYNAIFEEWYDFVDVDSGNQRDKKKLHADYENYLPPDVANYDDWNELFSDPERLVRGVLLTDGSRLFEQPRGRRFAALARVDWRATLQAANTKTHREVHSLWGVFGSTHRVWLVHALLFVVGVIAATGDPPTRSMQSQPLGGRSTGERFAAVGLLVPLHALLWSFAAWQTRGAAAKPHRSCLWAVRALASALFWAAPLATYAALRVSVELGWQEELRSLLLPVHFGLTACGLTIQLLVPGGSSHDRLWPTTGVAWRVRFVRYMFWLVVLGVKLLLSTYIFKAVYDAMLELGIAMPGHQSHLEVLQLLHSPTWGANILMWVLLWCTTFFLFLSDTQLWFTIACAFMGLGTMLVQRGCKCLTFALEDAVAKIPARFSEKVLPSQYAKDGDKNGAVTAPFSPAFPALWDRIVEYMRYEDKIDNQLMGDLSFDAGAAGRHVYWDELSQPLGNRYVASATPAEEAHGPRRVKVPDIFREKNPLEMAARQMCVPDPNWPQNADVQWRIIALARGLGLPMPRPFRAPYMPGITVLIPHYGESILMMTKELFQDGGRKGELPLMHWLKHTYESEYAAFTSRMQARSEGWPVAGSDWGEYTKAQWDKMNSWASMRMQTLWRTVAGMCLYHPALQCHFEAQADRSSSLARPDVWDPSECFRCLVSMQMYKFFDQTQIDHTNQMFEKLPDCLKVAFIDCQGKGRAADADDVHPRQRRRYFSCLIDKTCDALPDRSRVPKLRIELPGYPILGDGKGDNQNHAIPFMRGHFAQCIDANQGAYFEQMLFLPCALGEFRSRYRGDPQAKRIVGFPEHITSDIGSIGDFAASAEVAFGTILQRTYAALGARMHYGHPDIMNKVFMMQQGGVSKATKTLNLSEDIFAGMDFTLRGQGRTIHHQEYFHLAKGRDLGFNTVLGFFSKLASGTGEQVITRQAFRLGQILHLPEALTFYYAHVGYYFTQYLVSMSLPLLVFVWLLVIFSDCEGSFDAFLSCGSSGRSAAETMAGLLGIWFSWLLLLFLIASSLPLFVEVWSERSFKTALVRFGKQLCTLSPLLFIFQGKIIGHYVTNELRYGGATYVSTGRGLPTERRPFVGEAHGKGLKLKKVGGLYLDYAAITYYDGAMLLAGTVLIAFVGGAGAAQSQLNWIFVSLSLVIVSWLFAPFIFNPYQFEATRFWEDLRCLTAFFMEDGGRHWVEWYNRTQLRKGSGRSVVDIVFFLGAFFIVAWYAMMNVKIQALGQIFAAYSKDQLFELNVLMLMPPFICSMAYCVVAMALERIMGCYGAIRRLRRRPRRSGAAFLDLEAGAPGVADGAEVEEAEAREVHVAERDRAVKPAADPQGAGGESGCRCCLFGMPLAISAVCVLLLDIVEAAVALYRFTHVGWWRAFVAGLMLKWGISCLLLHLGEGVLRSQVFERCGRFGLVLDLWVRAHRMARDILTSVLILVALTPLVLINMLNDYLTPGLSLHHLLIYRNPNHLGKREAIVHACQWDVPEQPGAPQPKA